MTTDTERLDWLENEGSGISVHHDDHGHWGISDGGMQPVPPQDGTAFSELVCLQCFVEPIAWRPTLRSAIDAAMAERSQPEG